MDSIRFRTLLVSATVLMLAGALASCTAAQPTTKPQVPPGELATRTTYFSASLGIPQARPCIVHAGQPVVVDAHDARTPDEIATIIAVTPDGRKVLERKLRKGDPGIDVNAAQFNAQDLIVLTSWPPDPPAGISCPQPKVLPTCGGNPPPPPPCGP